MENPQPSQQAFNYRNDVFAIVGVAMSLFLAYVLYVQILDMKNTMKDNGFDINMPKMSDIVHDMDENELSYYGYLINLFSKFKCGIETATLDSFKTFITSQLTDITLKVTDGIQNQCSTSQLLDESKWGVFGKLTNAAAKTAVGLAGNMNFCATKATELALREKALEFEKILNEFSYKKDVINNLFYSSLSLGYGSCVYLITRVGKMVQHKISRMQEGRRTPAIPAITNGPRNVIDLTNSGGRRKTYKRKKRKHRTRKSRKSRKTRKSRKSRKSRRH